MTQWYFVSPGSTQRIGPLDLDAAQAHARSHPNDLCWREGLSGWQVVKSMPEFADAVDTTPPVLPPLPSPASRRSDDIDYRIVGNDMQFVEVELDPGESAIAEAGALMCKDASVQMDTVFGDGRHTGQGGGFMDKLMSAGKRVLTGESLFTTVFTHTGSGKAQGRLRRAVPGHDPADEARRASAAA